ncbi:MAG: amino acid permease, partial [Vicinamibacteria bacterium]|nr:amino acid permease [Vicinamibacteria bacterium]
GLASATSIVVANMVGAGIFTTSGLLMKDLHDAWLLLALWLIGGLIALGGALCYGELSAAIPRAGGEYVFLSRIFHPSLGFLSGWVSLFAGFSAPIAASAIGFSEYLDSAFPALFDSGLFGFPVKAAVLKKASAMAVIIAFTLIHLRGIRFGARVQNTLTLLKVGLIVALILWGFTAGTGDFGHLMDDTGATTDNRTMKSIGLSLMWIMFAYAGWNASAYIGSEIRDPVRNLPRSLLLGTGLVMALYIGLNLFFVYAVPPREMEGVISVAGLAATRAFGSASGSLVSLLAAFALFSSLSAYIILGPRVYFSMARDGYFFRFACKINPRFRVPSRSIVLQGAIALIMVLFGAFDQILTYMGFSLGIFPILATLALFKLRRSGRSEHRMPGYPLVPAAFVLVSFGILVLAFLERPVESSIAIAMVLVGIPVFLVFRKVRGTAANVASPADTVAL